MREECIVLTAFFGNDGLRTENIIEYFNGLLNNLYGTNFQELSYSTIIKSRLISKTCKYSTDAIAKMIKNLPVNGFELLSLLPSWKYKAIDINFSVVFTRAFNVRDSSLILTLNKDVFCKKYNNDKLITLYLDMMKYLIGSGAEITYGFIFSMDKNKFPGMFAAGVGNYELTASEEKGLQTWAERNDECDHKIWKIFWGNLVTTKHLKNYNSLEKLKESVGLKNFSKIDEQTYFFTTPRNNQSFVDSNNSSQRSLYKLFTTL